jgi:hypothetical protein
MAATAIPPQKNKAAIDRASTFCLCQGHPLSSAERSGANKKIGRVLYKGHDKSGREGGCKSLGMCVGKGGGDAKHKASKIFSSVALQHGHARAFART